MRTGKPRKNTKRVDPRYFLNEGAVNEIEVADLTSKGGSAEKVLPKATTIRGKKDTYPKKDFKEFLHTAKESLESFIDQVNDYVLIFFDTETTGLGTGGYVKKTKTVEPPKKSFQVTQWGAMAVNIIGDDGEYEVLGTFNPKQKLDRAFKWRMKKEKEREAAGQELKPDRRADFPLKLTRYGEKRQFDPETGKKKTASRYLDRIQNTVDFAQFIKNAEDAAGKPALLLAHNLPYDAKAIGAEFERARKEAWALRKRDEITYDEYMDMKRVLSATYPGVDTVVMFRRLLAPLVQQFKYFKEAGVATEEEAQFVDNMLTKAGNVSVSLGPTMKAVGVKDKGWHDALADVEMMIEVYDEVKKFIAEYDPAVEDPAQMKFPNLEEGLGGPGSPKDELRKKVAQELRALKGKDELSKRELFNIIKAARKFVDAKEKKMKK